MRKALISAFIPNYYAEDILQVDWQRLARTGVRLVFLDIDNTLEPQGTKEPGPRTRAVLEALRTAGLETCVLSNAKRSRADLFCRSIGLSYLGLAMKPLAFRVRRLIRQRRLMTENCLMVGDQLMTDLLCARFAGMPVLLVKSLGGEEGPWLRAKRRLEAYLIRHGADPEQAERADTGFVLRSQGNLA